MKKIVLVVFVIVMLLDFFSSDTFANLYFQTGFDSGVPSEFSGITTTEPVNGYSAYGFNGQFLRNWSGTIWVDNIQPISTTLTLTNLPTHTSIDLNFMLAIINTWDGDAGPDIFNVKIDGTSIFSESFTNQGVSQSYSPPVGVQLTGSTLTNLTGAGPAVDSAYNMGLDPLFDSIPHNSDTLIIEWVSSGAGWQGYPSTHAYPDEYWAIDNVEVILIPEPATLSLLALGGLALRRRKR